MMDHVTFLIASVLLIKMWCQNLHFFLFQHVMIHQGWEATDDHFFYSLISFRLLCTTDDFSISVFLLGNILRLLPWVMAFFLPIVQGSSGYNCGSIQSAQLLTAKSKWPKWWLRTKAYVSESKINMFFSIKQLELETEGLSNWWYCRMETS